MLFFIICKGIELVIEVMTIVKVDIVEVGGVMY